MESFSKNTPTELLKMINDSKTSHDSLKEEIIQDTKEIDRLTLLINEKLKKLEGLEKLYVTLIEEMNNRQ